MALTVRSYSPIFSIWRFVTHTPTPRVTPKPRQGVRKDLSYDIAVAVQQARLRAGLTQHELGTKTNYGATTIKRIENRQETASLCMIRQIEKITGVVILP